MDSSGQMQEKCRHLVECVDTLQLVLHIFQLMLVFCTSCSSSALHAWPLQLVADLITAQKILPEFCIVLVSSATRAFELSSSQLMFLQFASHAPAIPSSCCSRDFTAPSKWFGDATWAVECLCSQLSMRCDYWLLRAAYCFATVELGYLAAAELGCLASVEVCRCRAGLFWCSELGRFVAAVLGCCSVAELNCFVAAVLGRFAATELGCSAAAELEHCFELYRCRAGGQWYSSIADYDKVGRLKALADGAGGGSHVAGEPIDGSTVFVECHLPQLHICEQTHSVNSSDLLLQLKRIGKFIRSTFATQKNRPWAFHSSSLPFNQPDQHRNKAFYSIPTDDANVIAPNQKSFFNPHLHFGCTCKAPRWVIGVDTPMLKSAIIGVTFRVEIKRA
ncbi:hypothetical protein SLEP1_g16754 [Rubroshorea leprosula]|uniref:Uncharacterized protein n=1 Tax=Rubroshorea leprosula TaxID=152421 RepID=A0AAV5IRY6_9ROSI|nr:hypothetical protein SLEP1_g16754 [Rubroshorea leprosula]